jgi:hypothetical protein
MDSMILKMVSTSEGSMFFASEEQTERMEARERRSRVEGVQHIVEGC